MSRLIDEHDSYLLKLVKLIPVEVSAAYYAINVYLSEFATNFTALVAFALILLVACFYLIKWQTNSSQQALLTSFAFVIWALNISAPTYADRLEQALLACVLVLTALFLPRLISSR